MITSEYTTDNTLKSVVLCQHDISEQFIIKQRLYGHSEEYNLLLSAFDKLSPDILHTCLVSGASGSGKSALVSKIYEEVAKKDGIFLSGNCSIQVPYSVFVDAMDNFCNNILLEDNTTLANYRTTIQNAIGDEGKILTDAISNLHLIIGTQPTIADAIGN